MSFSEINKWVIEAHTVQKEHLELHKKIADDLQNLEYAVNQLQNSQDSEVLAFRTKTLQQLDHARKNIQSITEQHQSEGNIVVFMEETRNKFREVCNTSQIKQESPWGILEIGLQEGSEKAQQFMRYEMTMKTALESLRKRLEEAERIGSKLNTYSTNIHVQLLSFQDRIYTVTQ